MVKTIITVKLQSVKRFVGEVFKWICLDFVAFECSLGAVNPGSIGFLSQDDELSKRAIERWKEKIHHGRAIVGEYDGHKDLNEMATSCGLGSCPQEVVPTVGRCRP